MTTRSGFIKSSTAIPSLKNSGLEATSKSTLEFARIRFDTFSAVPTGTVLLSIITVYSFSNGPMSSATLRIYFRSAEPSSPGGVGKAKKIIFAPSIPSSRLVVKVSLFCFRFLSNKTSRPGSYIVIFPDERLLTFLSSISTQVTVFPVSAKQVPVTRPT